MLAAVSAPGESKSKLFINVGMQRETANTKLIQTLNTATPSTASIFEDADDLSFDQDLAFIYSMSNQSSNVNSNTNNNGNQNTNGNNNSNSTTADLMFEMADLFSGHHGNSFMNMNHNSPMLLRSGYSLLNSSLNSLRMPFRNSQSHFDNNQSQPLIEMEPDALRIEYKVEPEDPEEHENAASEDEEDQEEEDMGNDIVSTVHSLNELDDIMSDHDSEYNTKRNNSKARAKKGYKRKAVCIEMEDAATSSNNQNLNLNLQARRWSEEEEIILNGIVGDYGFFYDGLINWDIVRVHFEVACQNFCRKQTEKRQRMMTGSNNRLNLSEEEMRLLGIPGTSGSSVISEDLSFPERTTLALKKHHRSMHDRARKGRVQRDFWYVMYHTRWMTEEFNKNCALVSFTEQLEKDSKNKKGAKKRKRNHNNLSKKSLYQN